MPKMQSLARKWASRVSELTWEVQQIEEEHERQNESGVEVVKVNEKSGNEVNERPGIVGNELGMVEM